jgi:hypothetical protein
MPTILYPAKVEMAFLREGRYAEPLDGSSIAYTFDDAKAPSRPTTQ